MGDSAQLPLSRDATHRPRVLGDRPVRWVQVDFEQAAEVWEEFAAKVFGESQPGEATLP
jgi:iron(III) transport system substrate-binding protein